MNIAKTTQTLALFGILSMPVLKAQGVTLDQHVSAGGATTWMITTTNPNELLLIACDGYGVFSPGLSHTPGTVKVNGNNATYIVSANDTVYDVNFDWTASIWAYPATAAGTYTITCTESGLSPSFAFNFAVSLYQPSATLGLSNITTMSSAIMGGVDTVGDTITTGNYSFIYGTACYNGHGTFAWRGLTNSDWFNIPGSVDGGQAYMAFTTGTLDTVTSFDIGNPAPSALALASVQPNGPLSVGANYNEANTIHIYPIPASNVLNINVGNPSFGTADIMVFDITGRKVLEQQTNISSNHYALDISALDNGMYFLRINGKNGITNTRFEIGQ